MTHHEVLRYKKSIRVLHWIHSAAFVFLFLTGLIMFIPQLRFLAENSLTRIIHHVFAAIFVIAPIIYIIFDPKTAGRGLKEAFTWGRDDIGWLKAAPRVYLLNDEKAMPPQGHLNTGQKLWWLLVIVFGVISVITGGAMWFGKLTAPPAVLQRMVFVHGIAFIVTGVMFFVHIYVGVFHPLMTESWNAMTTGKISTEYAKMLYRKWYDEISKTKEEQT